MPQICNRIALSNRAAEIPRIATKESSMQVLVVDDEPLIRWALCETLEHAGHQVEETGDAQGTIDKLASGYRPDFVLLDFRLPDSDDLGLLRSIRRLSPDSTVVMMTAFGTSAMIGDAERIGASCVLSKPLDMNSVPSLVQRLRPAM